MHGYQSETELWKYGEEVEGIGRKMLNLRYQLLPYIYSEAWKITNDGSTMMRPLIMDFPEDKQAIAQPYQYMFGDAFLVAPVTQPGVVSQQVYLPKESLWYNYWTGALLEGGQTLEVATPLDEIPLFVKSGAIIPYGEKIQHASQSLNENLEIRIYRGADGVFTLYEDEGDNYNYEQGSFSEIQFIWENSLDQLTIDKRAGEFSGMVEDRNFDIVIIGEDGSSDSKPIKYAGEKMVIDF